MQAFTVRDRDAGVDGLAATELPYPHAAENDVVVGVHVAAFTPVEARNLAPLPSDVGHTIAAALPISGLSAWQGLFVHAGLSTGQSVLIHGAAGAVGSIAVQLARDAGAYVIGTGRGSTATSCSVWAPRSSSTSPLPTGIGSTPSTWCST